MASLTSCSLADLDHSTVDQAYHSSLAAAQQQLPQYIAAMQQAGWQVQPFVRSVDEKAGFLRFDDRVL
jgi:hypothetical protein